MKLKDKIALVTGGGAGIGRAGVEAFLREGAKVMVAELKPEFIDRLKDELPGYGDTWDAVQADVTDEASVINAARAVVEKFGRLDILYNNAGAASLKDGSLLTAEVQAFMDTIRLNLFGTWLMSRYAIPEIVKSGGGAVINTTSSAGIVGIPRVECYSAAKAGVISITKTMAMTFAPDNVRVNAIAPGRTVTERTAANAATRDARPDDIPLTRKELFGLGQPYDIANAAVFLASEDSRRITGHVIPVDSGFTL